MLAGLCIGVASALPAIASAAQYAPVAEYSFDEDKGETIEDLAGENDGTVEGAKWSPHGRYGGAMEYLNYESCVKVPDSPELRGGEEFTLEAWVRPTTVHEFMPIFYKQRGEDYGYGLWFDEAADGKPEGEINDGTYPLPTVKAEAHIPLDAWSHVALTFDGAQMRLYVDGQLVASAASAAPLASEGPLDIGCASVYGNEDHFEGRIDEARVYDRALSGPEVAADMETPMQTPKAGPVADWSFDEGKGATAADLTGHGHTATISKATWTRGRFGDALKFDGKKSCVTVAASEELDFNEELTLEAWVRPEGLGLHSVVAQEDESAAAGEDPFAYTLLSGDEENEGPRIWVRHPGGERGVAGGPTLPQQAWSHLAVTDDGAYLRFYVNGELTDTRPAVPLTTGSGPLTIGCMPIYGDYFKGRVDEVRIYGRALTDAEVGSDMEAPVQTPKTGPVADYSFDEGSGETAEDLTGNGHTATLQGAEWTPHGRYGGALEFDAEDEDFVSIPASGALDGSEEVTVEVWVRPTATPEYGSILMKEREGSGPRYSYALYQHDDQSSGYFHESEEGILISPEHSLPSDTWTHIAITDNGSASHLYVNGELVDTVPALPIEGHGEIRLGGNSIWGEFFDGRIDEVRIYDRSLTPTEVDTDMETPLVTPKAGPVADYSFDEENEATQADTSGNGHTATVEGAKWTPHGRYGGAMEFDGENDQLTIPDSPELRVSEEFTLEAWVRPNQIRSLMPVVAKTAPEEYGYALYASDGNEPPVPQGFLTEGEYVHGYAYSGHVLDAHAWTHLAIAFDGAHIRFFLNGVLVDTRSAEELPIGKGPLTIGGDEPFAEGGYFDGRIDEIRIYNRSLNETEVDTDMAAPIQTPQQGPIAAWSFDEVGEGNTAEDVTGNEHTATIEGAPLARGKYGEALQFDGENDVVKVPSSPDFALTEGFTLESWVRPESESNEWAPILAKEMGGGEAATELAWWLYEGDWHANEPFGGTEPTPGNRDLAHADDPLPVNAWAHVALTYDGAKVRLFINGELADCSPVPAGAPPVTEGELQIGAATEHGDYFKGRIDEVQIYNRALSQGEIQASMAPIPIVGTAEPYGVEDTDAIMTATINPRGQETTYKFQYGLTKSYGQVAPEEPEEFFDGNQPQEVEEVAEELQPETTYHYRVVAKSEGGTMVGPDQTLTTGPEIISEEELQARGAHLLATANWNGFFNMGWSGKSEESAGELNMVEKSGSNMFRVALPPLNEETETNTDALFVAAAEHHIKILPVLGGGHIGNATGGVRPIWQETVRNLVERYGENGSFWAEPSHQASVLPQEIPDHWEIWNEPNYGENGDANNHVDVKKYGEVLKEAHDIIKELNPKAEILLGGLLTVQKKKGMVNHKTVGDFIGKLNAEGYSGDYEIVSLHPYAFKGNVGKISTQVMKNIHKARAVLNKIHLPERKIWVTEIGWPVGDPNNDTNDGHHIPVGEQKQKELLESVFDRIKEHAGSGPHGDNIGKVFYYNVQDNFYGVPKDWATLCGLREDYAKVTVEKKEKPTLEQGKYRKAWFAFQNEAESPFAGQTP